jgi:hypothetical protein
MIRRMVEEEGVDETDAEEEKDQEEVWGENEETLLD